MLFTVVSNGDYMTAHISTPLSLFDDVFMKIPVHIKVIMKKWKVQN
jgi:hypothetical protein